MRRRSRPHNSAEILFVKWGKLDYSLGVATNHRCGTVFLLAGLGLALTGCVYTRLLSLKSQLEDFEKYVEVQNQGDLVLIFKKPVLLSKDLIWLTQLQPSEKKETATEKDWVWRLRKDPITNLTETMDYQLTFVTGFTSNRMTRITVPQEFLNAMPATGVVAMLKAFGHAQINEAKRVATADVSNQEVRKSLPKLNITSAEELFGKPHETKVYGGKTTYLYRYSLETQTLASPASKKAQALLVFDQKTSQLLKLQATFAGLGFRINL